MVFVFVFLWPDYVFVLFVVFLVYIKQNKIACCQQLTAYQWYGIVFLVITIPPLISLSNEHKMTIRTTLHHGFWAIFRAFLFLCSILYFKKDWLFLNKKTFSKILVLTIIYLKIWRFQNTSLTKVSVGGSSVNLLDFDALTDEKLV